MGFTLKASAQGFVVHQKDGSMAVFSTADVEDITMIPEEYCYILGTWYLGNMKNGEDITKCDGSEYMCFAGKELIWGGKNGMTDTYTPPKYVRRSTDIGVSPRLLNRMKTHPDATELW